MKDNDPLSSSYSESKLLPSPQTLTALQTVLLCCGLVWCMLRRMLICLILWSDCNRLNTYRNP